MSKLGRRVYFGLEFDHDSVPNAVVFPSSRPKKLITWVNSYKPTVIHRADGKEVLRERVALEMPLGYRLRKDEILGAMKRNKTENWQDGKFFTIMDHGLGKYRHPSMKEREQKNAQTTELDKGEPGSSQEGSDKPVESGETPTGATELSDPVHGTDDTGAVEQPSEEGNTEGEKQDV